jgi:hypothetical protein
MDKPSFLPAKNESKHLLREFAGYHKSKHSEFQFRASPNKREMQFRESKEYKTQKLRILFLEYANSVPYFYRR